MTAPLAWLIDTNVVSEMMRSRPEPRVAAFLDSIADEGIGLASISVWEVLDGIGRLEPGRRRRDLADRFRDLLDELFEDRIVEWTMADAQACAQIMEDKRRRGEPLDDHVPDAFIAASAATRGLAVVTRNAGEFRNTGVETVDPWVAAPR
ncbi:MAG: type II toxin-antitoxin system VapC family toxin [Rhodospirillaceae bacterium]|nr:type II toxin-antitoxin system VapC family toxin [Rhodospirillaceae bacterium]